MNKQITDTVSQIFVQRIMVELMRLNGKRITVTIGPEIKHGTDKQRRYYWSVIVAIAAECMGESKEAAHEALCIKLLRLERPDLPKGCIVHRRYSALSTLEREQYHADCRMLLAEWFPGIYVPLPNEGDY